MGKFAIYRRGKNHRPLHQEVKSFNNESNDGKIKSLFVAFLTIAASAQKAGYQSYPCGNPCNFCMDWCLKFWNYEAEGIVPFVANSPFMSFFYTKDAPEYKEYKLKEGELDERSTCGMKRTILMGSLMDWVILIMGIGILTFLGIFSPKTGLVGAGLAIVMTLGTLSFLVTTPEVWVPDLGSGEQGFPLLTGAGRLVIKDIAILAGAVVVLSDSAGRVLNQLKK